MPRPHAGGLCSAAFGAFADECEAKPNAPFQKSIGRVPPTGSILSPFVVNPSGATLDNNKLIMNGAAANSILFADCPVRPAMRPWDETTMSAATILVRRAIERR